MNNFFRYALIAGLCLTSTTYAATHANKAKKTDNMQLSSTQTKQIEQVVHNYLVNNPAIIVEAVQGMQKKEDQKLVANIKEQIPKRAQDIFNAKTAGREAIGKDKPEIMITEFFSYQCPNCRTMPPIIDKLIDKNKDLQVILIGWTFEGNEDIYAAKVDLAAQKQGKYYELYQALMKEPGALTQESIDKIAKSTGLDMDKLQKDMKDSSIEKSLTDNFKFAQDLKLAGTPTFIIANKNFSKSDVLFGRVSEEQLQKAINGVR